MDIAAANKKFSPDWPENDNSKSEEKEEENQHRIKKYKYNNSTEDKSTHQDILIGLQTVRINCVQNEYEFHHP